jgi:hypothetical protein
MEAEFQQREYARIASEGLNYVPHWLASDGRAPLSSRNYGGLQHVQVAVIGISHTEHLTVAINYDNRQIRGWPLTPYSLNPLKLPSLLHQAWTAILNLKRHGMTRGIRLMWNLLNQPFLKRRSLPQPSKSQSKVLDHQVEPEPVRVTRHHEKPKRKLSEFTHAPSPDELNRDLDEPKSGSTKEIVASII